MQLEFSKAEVWESGLAIISILMDILETDKVTISESEFIEAHRKGVIHIYSDQITGAITIWNRD